MERMVKRREWYFSASKAEEMANLHIFLVRSGLQTIGVFVPRFVQF